MKIKNYNVYFFILILIAVTGLAYSILSPFITALIVASVLSIVFHGVYRYFLKITRKSKALSSLLTCLTVLFSIVIPFTAIFVLLANEANTLYQNVSKDKDLYYNYILNLVHMAENAPFVQTMDLNGRFVDSDLTKSLQNFSQGFLFLIQAAYQNVIGFVVWTFVMFFSLYFFFIEGESILKRIMYLSPLKNEHEVVLIKKFVSMAKATLKGTITVGIVQGILGGLVFFVAGVPSFIMWGFIMTIFSIIPAVGSSIVWIPTGIVLLIMGNIWQGVFVLVFGAFVISLVDNILRPRLVGGDTEMHPLLVFFATLGGLMVYGFVGFIIGPIVMALFITLWDIYGKEFKEQLESFN